MLENNLYHSKFDFYEKTKKSSNEIMQNALPLYAMKNESQMILSMKFVCFGKIF